MKRKRKTNDSRNTCLMDIYLFTDKFEIVYQNIIKQMKINNSCIIPCYGYRKTQMKPTGISLYS